MEKTCIFKACKGNEWWYLYRYPYKKAPEGCFFRVYHGRAWYDRISWWGYEMALSQLLKGCLGFDDVHFGETKL